ncbi:MAG: helix-turn-helix transcriptional regulator [Methanocorpusculum sp.]|uniref:Helix-turn-helix transcriptional regulator n=1 Tax=Methanocorpusculum petauri TaxID=3002863 RepID=A0ABT4IJV0_9EURY|nr:helix-turn-helix transcriptional regulator [Methanocorpusculum petauri]MCZ9311770.1 helix-turn-helix transcriptional regulator [Methanocorpusculum sp.]MCZ0861537.1 helix-turn-helix transcriptional regulator [Methanocorpusculum petauri]MDE2443875.1 helix-turn-helix transcriptional regulator [Methanocorpusculum sp.]MDE2519077.1 helix-turn-helix transcriptional regulator [Methanocorpusculum sp.]MDE2523470.1 helix-turn-helix transcriptional regulator [Methanocorpusculum sp.]
MDNRIRELRAACGMTQQELADAVSVSSRTIISLEKGQYNPSVLLAHKIAVIFGLPIEEVFVFDEEDNPVPVVS